ncbi:thioesterase family protein [Desulfosporosinus sp.]|uniref:acyl-CoA thioesterase n=1 Tax=Desulfosporosinus sp. TaxID=157907 RepID=UPI0025C13AFC|nr:thioesterase family protein [Desulfosporosinus sp.]MBC2722399.1 acyl-CoA thioesterase [Desulfosporosinus sp.]MBC2726566.1 acyl-CoA thioesterase [Desulfosporosinus sp.]
MRSDFRFFHRLRVRYSEVDWQGIVFNAHYLTYLDVAVTEYFRTIGLDYKQLAQEGKMDMALVKTTLEYKSSAMFDDELDIGVRISHVGNTSYNAEFEIYKTGLEDLVLIAQTIYVNYNPVKRKSEPVPDFFRSLVQTFGP